VVAESWNMAAKEGLVICMRGPPVYCSLPTDLPEQILDYVLHVLAALSLLFESPCTLGIPSVSSL
jgi:hypothetical protein